MTTTLYEDPFPPLDGVKTSNQTTANRQTFKDLSDEETNRILVALILIVTPSISILGTIGNTLSIIILKKHGLKKCSDILLFGLAISDLIFLIGANINIICRMVHDFGKVTGFATSYTKAYVLYVLIHVSDVMDWAGGAVSFTVPVFITIERLVAVYLPLRYPILITPKRTTIAMIGLYVFCYSLLIYTRIWFQFEYTNDNIHNISVGIFQRSDDYRPQDSMAIQGVIIYLNYTAPLPIVVVGCIFIGVKVKFISLKRAKMVAKSNDAESDKKFLAMSRTVKTLLSVCAVYSMTGTFTIIPQYLPEFQNSYAVFQDDPSNISKVIYQVMYAILCINSSVNFLIYVATNKKFRDTQREIFSNCFK